jgi:hypothetical protein
MVVLVFMKVLDIFELMLLLYFFPCTFVIGSCR